MEDNFLHSTKGLWLAFHQGRIVLCIPPSQLKIARKRRTTLCIPPRIVISISSATINSIPPGIVICNSTGGGIVVCISPRKDDTTQFHLRTVICNYTKTRKRMVLCNSTDGRVVLRILTTNVEGRLSFNPPSNLWEVWPHQREIRAYTIPRRELEIPISKEDLGLATFREQP